MESRVSLSCSRGKVRKGALSWADLVKAREDFVALRKSKEPTIVNCANGIGDAIAYAWVLHSARAAGHPVKLVPRKNLEVFRMLGIPDDWLAEENPKHTRGLQAPEKGDPLTREGWLDMWLREFGYPNTPHVRPPFIESDQMAAFADDFYRNTPPYWLRDTPHKRVLIFPHAIYPMRSWPVASFMELAHDLQDSGVFCHALVPKGFPTDAFPSASTLPIEAVFSLIQRADLVICNESGPAHIAGVLNKPALVLCGPSPPTFHSHNKSLTLVYPDTEAYPCGGCSWNTFNGHRLFCSKTSSCPALSSITAPRVYKLALLHLGVCDRDPPRIRRIWHSNSVGRALNTGIAEDILKGMEDVIAKYRCTRAIETGTCDGSGSTTGLARALLKTGGELDTIEVNPGHHQAAIWNLREFPNVRCHLGLSLSRAEMPKPEQTQWLVAEAATAKMAFEMNNVLDAVIFYHKETTLKDGLPDDLLRTLITQRDPDFVFLDSAGHLGWAEWLVTRDLIKPGTIVALDDCRHVKHWKTVKDVEDHPELYEILFRCDLRHGGFIFRKR